MRRKIQAGGQEQLWRGMERWETSYTVSKASPKTRRGSAGRGAGSQAGWDAASPKCCDFLLNTCGISFASGGEKLESSFPGATLARLDRYEPRGLRTIPAASSPPERGARFGEPLRQAAGKVARLAVGYSRGWGTRLWDRATRPHPHGHREMILLPWCRGKPWMPCFAGSRRCLRSHPSHPVSGSFPLRRRALLPRLAPVGTRVL